MPCTALGKDGERQGRRRVGGTSDPSSVLRGVLTTNRKGFSRVRHHDELLEFERLFAPRGAHGRFEPNTDVHLEPENGSLVVHVELAGVDAASLRVALDDADLLIAGERTTRDVSRTASLLRREIQYGEFFKRIRLPLPVDDYGASATYRDGILTIELPLGARDRFPIVRTRDPHDR